MRFGRSFQEYQILHWSAQYFDFDGAKAVLKDAGNRDIDGFIKTFTRGLEKVEDFYCTQYQLAHQHAPQEAYRDGDWQSSLDPRQAVNVQQADRNQLEEHLAALLEVLENLKKLLWFGYVNFTAFQLLKKKSEKLYPSRFKLSDIGPQLIRQRFAHQTDCLRAVSKLKCSVQQLIDFLRARFTTEPPARVPSLSENLTISSNISLNALPSAVARRQMVAKLLSDTCPPFDYSTIFAQQSHSQLMALVQPDSRGRLPLHYAAESSQIECCHYILRSVLDGDQIDRGDASGLLLIADVEGNTPLHLSITGRHVGASKYLMAAIRSQGKAWNRRMLANLFGSLLQLATRCNRTDIAQLLIDDGANISYRGFHEETALHIATRKANTEIVRALRNVKGFEDTIDSRESVHGHTALMIACARGAESIIKLLVEAGADINLIDGHGWAAKEHAAFHGCLTALRYLGKRKEAASTSQDDEARRTACNALPGFLHSQVAFDRLNGQVLVSLGASNTRSNIDMVDLQLPRWNNNHDICDQTGFGLEISLASGSELKYLITLPVLEDLTNRPMIFDIDDPHEAKLVFKILQMHDFREHGKKLIGSGIAILKALNGRLASKHESLIRDHTVPILGIETLEMIGSVTFNFLIVAPFPHPPAPPIATQGFWKDDGRTVVVGHRGSGANTTSLANFQIGENTMQSFISALASGASCVEFDVQLTKDLVPVIFHDFLVMQTGGDVPLHTLTKDQFLHLGRLQSIEGASSKRCGRRYRATTDATGGNQMRFRSQSETRDDGGCSDGIHLRMQYTEEGMRNDIKGNLRGSSIQEPAATLEELFRDLPESVAFNLEMKYPMLWEAEDRDMAFFAPELNLFIDTILETVYRLAGKRSITFSSFSPDICIMLSIKQQDYPILFINKAGSVPTGDLRASNLQQAIQFAKIWRLAGIVMLSDVFVACPPLLQYAKSSGLVCASYGDLNDNPALAKV
ncbi:MAG: hypothetical protein Q9170_003717 [Blastenia crenularia]